MVGDSAQCGISEVVLLLRGDGENVERQILEARVATNAKRRGKHVQLRYDAHCLGKYNFTWGSQCWRQCRQASSATGHVLSHLAG